MQDWVLVAASGVVLFANWLNWIVAVGFAVAIILSFVIGDVLATQIAFEYHGGHVVETVALLRLIGVIGVAGCLAASRCIASLRPCWRS